MKKNIYVPHYDKKLKSWAVQTEIQLEYGEPEYVISEYIRDSLIYEYDSDGRHCHAHTFAGLIVCIIHNIEDNMTISFDGYEDEYSEQELKFLKTFIEKMKTDMKNWEKTT